MRRDERFREWCPHAVVLDGQMIGHAGYHGPPGVNANQSPDAVEIGYTIEEPWRGHGYATAAATELLRRAEERGVRHYVASATPDNEPSLAIIRKLGFRQTGEAIDEEDGLELVFELERVAPGARFNQACCTTGALSAQAAGAAASGSSRRRSSPRLPSS